MWQKTKENVKTSRYKMEDYQKWEYFTDEEDSEEELLKNSPQVPSEDPQFKALERDIAKRKARSKEDSRKGQELKQQGNQYFLKAKLELAELKYSEGIEIDKCNKALWLNRALVRIKLNKFELGVEDCTRMIEYMEFLEDGFQQSFNSAVKAFLRRAKGYLMLGKFQEGLEDLCRIEQVVKNRATRSEDIFAKELKEIAQLRLEMSKQKDAHVTDTLEEEETLWGQLGKYLYLLIRYHQ